MAISDPGAVTDRSLIIGHRHSTRTRNRPQRDNKPIPNHRDDLTHHQGHQLRLGEPSFAISAVRVTVAYICHLRKYMDGGDVEEGASTEQHGSASPRQGVKVSLQGRISYVLYI